jgi:hypothetical protein
MSLQTNASSLKTWPEISTYRGEKNSSNTSLPPSSFHKLSLWKQWGAEFFAHTFMILPDREKILQEKGEAALLYHRHMQRPFSAKTNADLFTHFNNRYSTLQDQRQKTTREEVLTIYRLSQREFWKSLEESEQKESTPNQEPDEELQKFWTKISEDNPQINRGETFSHQEIRAVLGNLSNRIKGHRKKVLLE